jgi:hypothetical protein
MSVLERHPRVCCERESERERRSFVNAEMNGRKSEVKVGEEKWSGKVKRKARIEK